MTALNLTVNDLKIAPNAQRALSLPWARKIGAAFDIKKCGPIMVSPRGPDGKYTILDGQHRWAGAKFAGYTGPFTSVVVSDATDEQKQAEAFLAFNNQKAVSNVDKFKVRVTAKDPLACEIDRELRAFGLVMGSQVTCVNELERVANRSSEQLSRTLKIITQAWSGRAKFANALCVRAVSRLVNERTFDQNHMIERLKEIEPVALIAKANAGRELLGQSRDTAAVNLLVRLYNKSRRSDLLEEFTNSKVPQ